MHICKHCNLEKKNLNSLRNHERLCQNNKERKISPKTEKWYEAMRKRNASNHYIKAKNLGIEPPKITEETREKLSIAAKNKIWKKESLEKLSRSRAKIIEEKGAGGFLDVKYFTIKNTLNEEFIVRGTWELRVAEELNKQNIVWVRKKYLKYYDGYEKTYTPDFFLPEKNIYIEVKGYFSDADKRKINLVNEYNSIDVVVLHGKNIDDILRECHIRVIMPVL